MQLTNEMRIGRPPTEVFDALLDVERVAGCMPGSKLTGKTDDDTYAGEVKVKVGPLSAAYSGTVRYVEVDRENHRITLQASGKEQGGQGNADAHVVAGVLDDGDGAKVSIDTDLMIRGKVAQFGSGVIGEVSERLIDQFANNVEQLLAGQQSQVTTPASADGEPATQPVAEQHTPQAAPQEAESTLDGLNLVLIPMLKRAAPVIGGVAAGLLVGVGLGGRRKDRSVRSGGATLHLSPHTAYLLLPLGAEAGR